MMFYIGRRDNPQLAKPYFKGFGRLSVAEARKKENPLYGAMTLSSFKTESEYRAEILRLSLDGFSVTESVTEISK